MSINLVPPNILNAKIKLPASKSISNRTLIIHALACRGCRGGETTATMPDNLSDCDDTQVMIRALETMPEEIDIMAAGTAMRFLTAYLSVTPGTHVITGTERMRHRPIGILVDALRQLGARIEYLGDEGFPPLRITGGNLRGCRIRMAGNVSSQYISALLMIGPVVEKGLEIKLTGGVVSKPYIDMTLGIMRDFGARAEWTSGNTISVSQGGYRKTRYYVESDWSAGSYWYQMTALSQGPDPVVTLPGLFADSLQGDSVVRDLFRPLGVATEFARDMNGTGYIRLTRQGRPCRELERDLLGCPDLAQTMVATCALLGVRFRFTGLQSLRIKETDRMAALRTELAKLGYGIKEENGDTLYWDGTPAAADARPAIDTYEDHRMAMSMAPACMVKGSIRINNPEVVSKSYPRFWDDLRDCGFAISDIR